MHAESALLSVESKISIKSAAIIQHVVDRTKSICVQSDDVKSAKERRKEREKGEEVDGRWGGDKAVNEGGQGGGGGEMKKKEYTKNEEDCRKKAESACLWRKR